MAIMSLVESRCVTLLGDPPPEAQQFHDYVHANAKTPRTSGSSDPISKSNLHCKNHLSLNTRFSLLPQRRGGWKPGRNTTVDASKLHKKSHYVNELTKHAILSFTRPTLAWDKTQLAALREWKKLRLEEHVPGNIFERLDREDTYTSKPDEDMITMISIFNRLFFFNAVDIEFRWERGLTRKGKEGFGVEMTLDHGRLSLIRMHSTLIQEEVVSGSGKHIRTYCRLATLLHEMAHAYLAQYSDPRCQRCLDIVGIGGHCEPWQLLTSRLEEASIYILEVPLFLGRFHSFLNAVCKGETPYPSPAEVEKWRLLHYWPALRTGLPAEGKRLETTDKGRKANKQRRKPTFFGIGRKQKKETKTIKDRSQTSTTSGEKVSERSSSPASFPPNKRSPSMGVDSVEESGSPETSLEGVSTQTSGEMRPIPPPKTLKKVSMPRLHYSVLKSLGLLRAK